MDKFKESLNLYVVFFSKVDDGLGDATLEETLEELGKTETACESEWMTELVGLSKKIIHNYLCFASNKFDLFVSIDSKFTEALMDFQMLKFQAFSRNNQIKEAKRMYEKMKSENDEHILVNFCQYEIENRIDCHSERLVND